MATNQSFDRATLLNTDLEHEERPFASRNHSWSRRVNICLERVPTLKHLVIDGLRVDVEGLRQDTCWRQDIIAISHTQSSS